MNETTFFRLYNECKDVQKAEEVACKIYEAALTPIVESSVTKLVVEDAPSEDGFVKLLEAAKYVDSLNISDYAKSQLLLIDNLHDIEELTKVIVNRKHKA